METRVVSVVCDPVGDAIQTNERVCTALVDGLVVISIGAQLRCFGEDLLVVQFITVSSTYANQIELISDLVNEPYLMLSCLPLGIYPPLGSLKITYFNTTQFVGLREQVVAGAIVVVLFTNHLWLWLLLSKGHTGNRQHRQHNESFHLESFTLFCYD